MRKKVLVIVGIVLLIIILLFLVNATKGFIMYDNIGRVKVYADQEKPDIEDGTQSGLVAPELTEETRNERLEKERKKDLAEKREFEEKSAYSANTMSENEPLSEEDRALMDSVMHSNDNLEENVIQLLKKYTNEDIDTLFSLVQEESSKVTSGNLQTDYVIGENGIRLIKIMLGIIDGNQATENEKSIIIEYLKGIELHGIKNDDELKTRLENL